VDPQQPTPEFILWAYRRGIFPMADPETERLDWYSPDPRAILPLDRLHVPRRLARTIRGEKFEIQLDTAFDAVIRACAAPRKGRWATWLDERLLNVYCALHRLGHARSIEAWRNDTLVGGLYGVHIGAAFFGESMFCLPEAGGTDASKVCLVELATLLRDHGFRLFDTQFRTRHLAQFGCIEIRRRRYLEQLAEAVDGAAEWPDSGRVAEGMGDGGARGC
jgi:leucyl/phenylalanyl-tRNA--protein transferase